MLKFNYHLEALVVLLSLDCYLREQDWEQLRGEDIFVHHRTDAPPEVALMFGRRHRGEAVKTGQEQGVKVADEFVARCMAALHEAVRDDELVFGFSSGHFREVWKKALQALDLAWVGPPRTLRHSGPSADAASGRRDLEQIRRRGRWLQMKSVQRYSKAHALTMHYARLPSGIKERGRSLMERFERTCCSALPSGAGRFRVLKAALEPMLRRDSQRGARPPVPLRAAGLSQRDPEGSERCCSSRV